MKVTLNKANKLRNSLEKIEVEFPHVIALSTGESEEASKTKLDAAMTEFAEKWKRFMELSKGIKQLRSLIHTYNQETGVTTLMAEIASVNRVIRHASGLTVIHGMGDSWEGFKERKAYFDLLTDKSETPPRPNTYSVRVVDEEAHNELLEFIADQKLQLEDLVEKRNAINSSNYIELPKDLVELLREFRLVK